MSDYPRHYNAAAEMVDRHLAESRSEKAAFVDPARTLTYGGLAAESNQVANLMGSLGLRREERLACILLDTCDYPPIFWGAIKAGVVPIALNTLLTSEQYRYILEDSRARAVFVSSALLPVVQPALDGLAHLAEVIVVGEGGDYTAKRAAQPDTFTLADTVADEVAFWLYSSGSTGMPKGTKHLHTSAMETCRIYAKPVLGIMEDDVFLSAAKLFFAYGLGNGMTFPLSVGGTAILWPERPTPDAMFALMQQHRPTLYFGVPTLYAAMLAGAHKDAGGRLRYCVSAGEALPEEVGKAWEARFGVPILDGIGSTEMLHIFLSNRAGAVRYGTSGQPIPGYDLRLVDDDGTLLSDGEIGELVVRGPTAAEGYWNQREKTRLTFRGEWTHTGDKYMRSADGYYTYQGRTDDMFKVSGIWVSPFEVESALISHEAVLEAAVVPHDEGDGLLKPKAYVVLKDPAAGSDHLFETLKAHVQKSVGPWKYPRWVEVVDELPKTATGKIQRYKLRS
jgi:4-hydroxybenzoate-CoA ligase